VTPPPRLKPTRSKCIGCGKQRSCIKIEARAPLAHGPVYVWNEKLAAHDRVDYEAHGPMIEICKACLREPLCPLATYLAAELELQ
jgi:hypothetical protein